MARDRLGASIQSLYFPSPLEETANEDSMKIDESTEVNKYRERCIDRFAEQISRQHRSKCEVFSHQLVSTLKGMVKSEQHRGQFLERFDLGCIP